MTTVVSYGPWAEEALFSKCRLYIEKMERHRPDEWEFALWSSLALELLARACLARVSPALLADDKNWHNMNFALGRAPITKKFTPISIGMSEVMRRLGEIYPEITQEVVGFCAQHIQRRNAELHSGELGFNGIGTSTWLPSFYFSAKAMLDVMGRSLGDIFSNPGTAEDMIAALKDSAAKSVDQDIKAYQKVWGGSSRDEKQRKIAQATAWATRHSGHRVDCPSCGSPALLQGSPSGSVSTEVNDDDYEIVQRQAMLPTSFECIACGLKIIGLSRLSACGLGDAFVSKSTFTPAEYFELYTEDDLAEAKEASRPDFEMDFND